MKKRFIVGLFVIMMFSLAFASAEACDPTVSLLNQDPYPAVPGEYVKLVFQITELDNPECGDFSFELLGDYPITLQSGDSGLRKFKKVDYIKDYTSSLQIPYRVQVDENAFNGAQDIEVQFKAAGNPASLQTLQIEIKETTVGFEAYIKEYDYNTRELTIEVLNIGDSDIEALTIEIPKQENVEIKGSNRVVVGDLDSNEFTSADFEAIPQDGTININLVYSDSINVRRTTTHQVTFDSSYFTNRVADQKETSPTTYIIYAIILLIITWWIYKRVRKKKKRKG